jgi:hypothetical protein
MAGTLDAADAQFSHIVAINAQGTVAGYAMRSPGRTLREALLDTNPGWQGHINAKLGVWPVTIYALNPRSKTACYVSRLGTPGSDK